MDVFLGKVTQQAMNYAIRSGITITATYAIKQSARLLKAAEATSERDELQDLQEHLDSKIRIISPAIDMIELISARGNTSLESAVSLTKQLRCEIQELGQRLQTAANAEEVFQRGNPKAKEKAEHAIELRQIAHIIRKLLSKIEDAVPLINLAITASGASLSSSLPPTVSPSRLLQASTFLTAGDSQYVNCANGYMQIGPTFILSMYMLFSGHIRAQNEDDVRESTWKEAIHKSIVRLMRVSLDSLYAFPGETTPTQNQNESNSQNRRGSNSIGPVVRTDEFAYQLVIVEDLDDDRMHSFDQDEPQPERYGDIDMAGIRELVPIHEISKIFYADTGKILNIGSEGEANNPVLLLKRDPHAIPPRRMVDAYNEFENLMDASNVAKSPAPGNREDNRPLASPSHSLHRSGSIKSSHSQQQIAHTKDPWRLPYSLDPEWMAFEVYKEADDADTETEEDSTLPTKSSRPQAVHLSSTTSNLSHLHIDTIALASLEKQKSPQVREPNVPSLPAVRTSLSLLEMLIRLLSLQQFQQTPHLSIPDELLTFFLSESASTGVASNDVQERRRLREDARRRVGFDPYDESPVKRRGEEYQYNGDEGRDSMPWEAEGVREFTDERYGTPVEPVRYDDPGYDDEGYNTRNTSMPSSNSRPLFEPRRAATESPAERWFRNRPLKYTKSASTGESPSPGGAGRPPSLARRSEEARDGLRSMSATVLGRK